MRMICSGKHPVTTANTTASARAIRSAILKVWRTFPVSLAPQYWAASTLLPPMMPIFRMVNRL